MSLIWPDEPSEVNPHQEIIRGLLLLVGWLTDHPELPLEGADMAVLHLRAGLMEASESQQIAYVREMARLLDVEPMWSWNRQYFTAERKFGVKVSIEAVAKLSPSAAVTEQLAVVGEAAMPEIDCEPCQGTGFTDTGPQRAMCPYCLGKGRILAWQPRHAAGAQAW